MTIQAASSTLYPKSLRDARQRQGHRQAGELHQQLPTGHGDEHLAALHRVHHFPVIGNKSGHALPLRQPMPVRLLYHLC